MKYIVNRTCFFGNRLYEQGEAVEFGSAAVIPEWFTPVDEPKHEPTEDEPKAAKRSLAGGKTKSKE